MCNLTMVIFTVLGNTRDDGGKKRIVVGRIYRVQDINRPNIKIIIVPMPFSVDNYHVVPTVVAINRRQLHQYDSIRKTLIFVFFSPRISCHPLHSICVSRG